MKQKIGRCITLFTALAIVLAFVGCNNVFQPSVTQSQPGKGTLYLSINGSDSARTILPPTVQSEFDAYTIEFALNGGAIDDDLTINLDAATVGSIAPVQLEPGEWTITATAFIGSDEVAVKTLTVTVVLGEASAANLVLEPIAVGGIGTFSWDITFPDEAESGKMTIVPVTTTLAAALSLYNSGTGVDGVDFDVIVFDLDEAGDADDIALEAGLYLVVFEFVDDEGKKAVRSDALHIYKNLESIFAGTDAIFTGVAFTDPTALFTVTFNKNHVEPYGFTDAVPSILYLVDGETAFEPVAPTRDGATFTGWATTAAGGTAFDFNAPITENAVAYAQWDVVRPRTVDVKYGTPAISLDAIDKLWDDANPMNIIRVADYDNPTPAYKANPDTFGIGKALWDDDYVYVFVRVADAEITQGTTNPWLQDCVEVYVNDRVDTNGKVDSTSVDNHDGYQNFAGQYRVTATGNVSGDMNNAAGRFNETSSARVWKQFAGTDPLAIDGLPGYAVMFRIPWRAKAQYEPKNNKEIGLEMTLAACVLPGGNDASRLGVMAWSNDNGPGNYNQITHWGVGTLTGKPEIYTVTFDTAGGEPETIDSVQVEGGQSIGSAEFPSNPTKAGFTFDGWYDEDDVTFAGPAYTAATTITKNTVLVAKWAYASFSIKLGDEVVEGITLNVYPAAATSRYLPDGTGFDFDKQGGGSRYSYNSFQVNLGEKRISDFSAVKITVERLSGTEATRMALLARPTAFPSPPLGNHANNSSGTGWLCADQITEPMASTFVTTLNEPTTYTLPIGPGEGGHNQTYLDNIADASTVYFSIYTHNNVNNNMRFSNIEFIEK